MCAHHKNGSKKYRSVKISGGFDIFSGHNGKLGREILTYLISVDL